jgi:hypothetical protein
VPKSPEHPVTPSPVWVDLLVCLLVNGHDISAVVENNKTSAGRALIDRANVLSHESASDGLIVKQKAFALKAKA